MLSINLQIFFPDLSLAFEYQGEYHFYDGPITGSCKRKLEADRLKEKVSTGI